MSGTTMETGGRTVPPTPSGADTIEQRDKLAEAAATAFMNVSADSRNETRQVPRPQSKRRTSFDEYLSQAREAWQPGVTVTPAWIREVTGCSRGLSSRLDTALAADMGNSGGQS